MWRACEGACDGWSSWALKGVLLANSSLRGLRSLIMLVIMDLSFNAIDYTVSCYLWHILDLSLMNIMQPIHHVSRVQSWKVNRRIAM